MTALEHRLHVDRLPRNELAGTLLRASHTEHDRLTSLFLEHQRLDHLGADVERGHVGPGLPARRRGLRHQASSRLDSRMVRTVACAAACPPGETPPWPSC